ncbi:multidrug export protein EmrA [Acetobacter pasteurianus]|uniref:Multidrug resistance transporter HlyD/EmrA/FusE n=5 Tax=Acetobacter pasteurianus TaxID=438 RepID=C7JGB8_ACEP3|nr:HlyD family secretion protein [Acetobacter pasteurianus]BAU38007.1 multidrug resistance protein A [Acetobacter pasteurianus NBRC 101655]QHM90668.1 HlyD family secretion protein [Acetobacter pasteurianus]RCL10416.1 multidrug export protein EmrA [Acetobacter pasteurianus]BAH99127.1 multidrug resistance transporter HlyD/EmrA/FusE [Acetobacter pasteurianus IFO 3283-01]BAI02178.1 multidrug resistance transporter HlyD/EmrA/FusE [Acetobacter pasteurianus IFO 3283-03]
MRRAFEMAGNSMTDDHNDQSSANTGAPAKPEEKKKENPRRKIILTGVIAVLAVGAGVYWFMTRNEVETDDAFTAGRAITIAPHVSGYVTELLVNDNQFVRKGQLLARIDPRDWKAARDQAAAQVESAQASKNASDMMHMVAMLEFPGKLLQAKGQLEAAKAQEFKAQTDFRRQHVVERAATSQQDIDSARAALDAAKARVIAAQGAVQMAMPVQPNIQNAAIQISQEEAAVKTAQARLETANLNLEWTEIRAPHDGWISQRNLEQGNYVQQGQNILSIVEPEVWVVANYKETQITRMKPGQKVDIKVDAYPSLKVHGHIDSLQKGTGAQFSAFPPENATGNYVKIVQRVPVKILIDDGLDPNQPLALGMSVVPTVHVDTQGHSDAAPRDGAEPATPAPAAQ